MKNKLIVVALAIATCLSIGGNIYQHNKIVELEQENVELRERYTEIDKKVSEALIGLRTLRNTLH